MDASALAVELWREPVDLPLLLPLRRVMLEEKELFIRKAIGWVPCETGKKRPELVAGWLEPRARRASGLTFREATRSLPARLRARLEEARG